MPRIKIHRVAQADIARESGLPPDGRQSHESLAIRRGVCRRLRAEGYAVLAEMVIASGRRIDIAALSDAGEIVFVEIKSSIEDYRVDSKWPDYLTYSDRFYFATSANVPIDIFPEHVGLMVADSYGAEIIRHAPLEKIAAATRKSMLVRLARAGMTRLHDLDDPNAQPDSS